MTAEPTSDAGRRAGPLQGIVLLLQITLAVMGTTILAPVIPAMMAHFRDVPEAQLWTSTAITIPSLAVALLAPLAGWLADRFGRRRLLLFGVASYGVVGTLPYFLTTLPQIIASRLALGAVEAIITTVSTTLIGDYFSARSRDRWLGRQTAVASLSAVALLALGGVVGESGWRAPFLLYLTALPLALAIWAFTWEPSRLRATQGAGTWEGFPWLAMGGICAMTLAAAVMFYIVQINMSVALTEMGENSSSRIGLLIALVSLGVPLGTLAFQRCAATRIERLLLAEFLIMGVGFIGMSHARTLPVFLLVVTINQIGSGMVLPTMLTWAMRQLDMAQRGRGVGIWQSVFALGPPLGPPLIAVLMTRTSSRILPTFQALGIAAIALAAGCAFASLRRRSTGRAELT